MISPATDSVYDRSLSIEAVANDDSSALGRISFYANDKKIRSFTGNEGHIARATLEATAYQTREVLDAMNKDSGVKLKALKVDGGMTHNEMLMQFQSDLLGVPVVRPTVSETTALGAAYAAGLAIGYWRDTNELRKNWGKDVEWKPKMKPAQREKLYAQWKKAVTRTFDWVE